MANSNTVSLDSLRSVVADAAAEFGIPEDSIWRKLRAENSGSPEGAAKLSSVRTDAVSPKNAKGIMQVTQVALDDVIRTGLVPAGTKLDGLSPADQIRIGAAYIKNLRNYSTDPAVEDAMYNYGPKARFRMDRLPEETRGYLQKSGARMADNSGSTPAPSMLSSMMASNSLLSMLIGNNNQQNAALQSGVAEVSGVQQEAQQKQEVARGMQMGVIDAAGRIAETKAAVNYETAQLGQQLQQLFGLDPSASNYVTADNLARYQAAESARAPIRAEYDAAASTDFLSNPLGYLVAQLKMPALAARNNALADEGERALQDIRVRTDLLAAQKNVLVANTADQVKQLAVDEARNGVTAAKAKLTEEEAKNLAQTASQQMQKIAIIDKIADNNRSTLTAAISIQDREEQQALRRAAQAEIDGKKQADQADEDRLNSRLATVSATLGLAEPMTVKRLRTLQSKKDQDVWLNAAMSGQLGEDLQGALGFYLGSSSRVGLMNSGGASVYNTAQKLAEAGSSLKAAAERAAMATNLGGKKPTDAESQRAGFKMYEDMVVKSMRSPTETVDLSSSTWDKTFNPYVAPFKSFNLAVATRPELVGLRDNTVVKTIGTLLSSDAVKGENLTADQQQQVFGAILKLVETRAITPAKAAADINVYMRAASAFNSKLNGYSMFALPQQDTYLYTMDGPTNRTKVDLMNPVALENTLTKQAVVARKVNSSITGVGPFLR